MKIRLAVLLAPALLGACVSAPPLGEVRLVSKAFGDLNAASAPLLDDFAAAERQQGKEAALQRAAQRAAGDGPSSSAASAAAASVERCPNVGVASGAGDVAVQDAFCADDSYYYSEVADPPATAAVRRSLAAVGDYTELLLILAEGRNIAVANAQIQSLSANLGGALQLAGASTLGPAVGVLSKALDPVLGLAAKRANSRELARNVTQVSGLVIDVTEQLRLTAPEMFETLVAPSLGRLPLLVSAESATTEVNRIEAYRAAVSSYVVLLDEYRRLLERLVAAYDTDGNVVTLAGLAEQSAELSAHADAWRRTFSALRLGFN